jgi:hypothetical protein
LARVARARAVALTQSAVEHDEALRAASNAYESALRGAGHEALAAVGDTDAREEATSAEAPEIVPESGAVAEE